MTDEELETIANARSQDFQRRRRRMEDFRYDEVQEKYWDTTTGILLGAKSVDGAIALDDWPTRLNAEGEPRPYAPSKAINDVDTGLTVEGSTWWPGMPRFIQGVVVSERGAMPLAGAVCYNSYIPPEKTTGTGDAQRWIDHVKLLYPEPVEHEHFFDFCAHAIQRPDQKVNHGIVMAGAQGIGKDTALLPVRRGIGEWNAAEVGPDAVTSQYNGFVKSVLLIINEVRPLDDDYKASNFYNLLKPLLASPPEMTPMTVKYANTIYIRNLCHVVLTTNDPLTMYIPAEDRRLFVMTSLLEDPKMSDIFEEGYFESLHEYLSRGGADAAVRWLAERDISSFGVSEPPPMTNGKMCIIESATQVRRSLVDDLIEQIVERKWGGKRPEVILHRDLSDFVRTGDLFDDIEAMVKILNAKNFHFKMAERGYDMMRNKSAPEWRLGKLRTRLAFVRRDVPVNERETCVMAAMKRWSEE